MKLQVERKPPKPLERQAIIPARAVCVHDLEQARATVDCAMRLGRGVVLLSGPGAAGYAGCGWWRALISAAVRADAVECTDLLDCGDSAGYAMAALRAGLRGVVLSGATPALTAVCGAAALLNAVVLTERPDNLDLSELCAPGSLEAWIAGRLPPIRPHATR